jgi:nitrogen fixation protein NifB
MPGNARTLLNPEDALSVMDKALKLCPEIRVAGVAGPGDPLAGPEALEALRLVKREHPDVISCLSTNGLALPERMEEILEAGVQSLTVTVNALDPEILLKVNRGIILNNQFIGGIQAQEILISAQERGIRAAVDNSIAVKINTVLIPEINGRHIEDVAARASDWGAAMMNVIPLIPAREFKGFKAPAPEEHLRAVEAAERRLPVKLNCRRCRADACGVPGVSDFSGELYGDLRVSETFSHG